MMHVIQMHCNFKQGLAWPPTLQLSRTHGPEHGLNHVASPPAFACFLLHKAVSVPCKRIQHSNNISSLTGLSAYNPQRGDKLDKKRLAYTNYPGLRCLSFRSGHLSGEL